MPKMASDFLQSNLFNPTAPSEQFLERARRRRIKGSNSDLQEAANRRGPFSNQVSRNPDHTLDQGYNFHCNNNNSYAFRNYNTCRNPQSKKTETASPLLTQTMLKSMVSEGLIKLPGPPEHPRPDFSGNADVSAKTARRNRVKNNCSQNSHQDLSIFSGTREILTQDNQCQSFYSHANSLGQLFPRQANINLENDTSLCADDKSNDASHKNEECNEQSTDLFDRSTRITPYETVEQLYNDDAQDEISLKTSVPLQEDEPLSTHTKSELICNALDLSDSLQRFPDTEKGEANDQGSDNNQRMDEAIALCDAFNLLQMKTELDKSSLINKCSADKASKNYASQVIDKRLFRETFESCSSRFAQKSEAKTVEIRATDQFTTPDEAAKEDIKPTNLAKKSKGNRKFSSKRKQLLRLLHLFLGIRWMKTTQKEDKKSLVEEEITEGDGNKQELTAKRKKKKMKGNKQTFGEQKARTQNHPDSGQGKDLRSTESTSVKRKKRRRPRKKNVYLAARRIRRSLGYGCRYIGHGLVNMTSIIPEASYLGPVGHTRTFPTQYIHNDYYDPNAPEWDCQKGPYIQSPFV